MARRSKAREVVLQMLYQIDVNPDVDARDVRRMIEQQIEERPLQEFAWQLFSGVMECRGQLDERIESAAENWTLDRMAPTDRNALRLGAFELVFTETPYRIVIDEAIELARRFGTAQSSQFVNGILDRLVPQQKRSQNGTLDDVSSDPL